MKSREELEIELLKMYIREFSPSEEQLKQIILWNCSNNVYVYLPGNWSEDKAKLLLENV